MIAEEISIVKQLELNTATLKLRSDGILQYNMKAVDDFGVKELKDLLKAVGKFGGEKKFLNLIFMDYYINPDSETRNYNASEECNKYTIADAYVVGSSALKLIGNFYIKVNRPVRPTKIFSNETEALDWLYTFL